ncbi:MAG: hypothetical protein ACREFX_07985 [Opitutaceae bacterium]
MTPKLRLPLAFTSLLFLAGAGCASHRSTDQLAQAVTTGERPVAMEGRAEFFGGTVRATVTISRGIGRGERLNGGGRHGHGHEAEMPDLQDMDEDQVNAYLRARGEIGSPMPPVTLRLELKNLSDRRFSVDVTDFESDLGNFAVTPEILAVAPGQSAQPNPMISQLGVASDTIPVKVSLKVGDRQETQTIEVKTLPPEPGRAR